jgi:hypothetical protein
MSVTVDRRTRPDVPAESVDPASFAVTRLPELLEANGRAAGDAALRLGLAPLTFSVEGEQIRLVPTVDGLAATAPGAGGDGGLVATMDAATFGEILQDALSLFGAQMTGRAAVAGGDVPDYLAWEPVLRCLLDGRPVHRPGSITFADRHGRPLDLHRSFTLDDDHADIGHFLAEAGYLHLEGVFTEAEMAAVSADLDAAMAAAEPDDGASWWARTAEGWYPSRILGFNQRSAALRELLHSDRFRAVGTLTGDRFVQRDPDRGDAAEGLHKRVGVLEGISDVSWHKDCSMGGHSRQCCGLVVGISITGAGPENGELGTVAGSHRANLAHLGVGGLDLPRVALPTRTGDLTVHCTCTLHMSRPPVSAERRVVYTGFGLAARPEDRRAILTEDEIRAARASLNDHVRRRQDAAEVGADETAFDL